MQPENKFQVVAGDIIDLMGLNRSNAYRDMKMAVDKLYNRSIKSDGEGSEMRWIYRKKYVKDEGKISLYFPPEIIPYLSQLSNKFTAYKLKYVSQFKSSYSLRSIRQLRISMNIPTSGPKTGSVSLDGWSLIFNSGSA